MGKPRPEWNPLDEDGNMSLAAAMESFSELDRWTTENEVRFNPKEPAGEEDR